MTPKTRFRTRGRLPLTLSCALALTLALAGNAAAQLAPTPTTSVQQEPIMLAKARPGTITRLEDLAGLPCGTGTDAGAVALAINPLSGGVEFACARPGQFLLDVAVGGPGTVLSVTPEITCGLGAGDCAHVFDTGDVVRLSASSEAGTTVFDRWGGACAGNDPVCEVAMSQARQVTATFLPTLTLHIGTFASARNFNCVFNICIFTDSFSEAFARVTVTDLDTGLVAGTCDSDTTIVVPSSQVAPPAFHVTDCNVPVVPGHHLRLTAEDMTTLGGVKSFQSWGSGPCAGSANPVCTPADAVTVHDEVVASYN